MSKNPPIQTAEVLQTRVVLMDNLASALEKVAWNNLDAQSEYIISHEEQHALAFVAAEYISKTCNDLSVYLDKNSASGQAGRQSHVPKQGAWGQR